MCSLPLYKQWRDELRVCVCVCVGGGGGGPQYRKGWGKKRLALYMQTQITKLVNVDRIWGYASVKGMIF